MSYDLFEVRVANFIFNDEKKLLLLKNNQGTWGILGGHLDKGEQIEETVHREAKEEANIEIEIIKQIGMKALEHHPSFVVVFACKYKSGEIKLQEEEIQDYKWVNLNELDKYELTFPELPEEAKKALSIIEKTN
jgi:NADH pyrophosphatase NudC (nudix superfamily)